MLSKKTPPITTLCELFLFVYNCIWIGKFQAYTAAVALILLPVKHFRDWVRFQESCGLDLTPFFPPAQSNFQDSRLKWVSLFQWGGIHPPAKSVWKGTVQLLHKFEVVFNITASWSGGLCYTPNSGTHDPDWDASLSRQTTGINSEHHKMCFTPLCRFCHLHVLTHQRTSRERSQK